MHAYTLIHACHTYSQEDADIQAHKDAQMDTKTHSDNYIYRNTLRYKHKDTDTHINVQRLTNTLKDIHIQRCKGAPINTATQHSHPLLFGAFWGPTMYSAFCR